MVNIKGTIISKGRKYFKIKLTGEEYINELVINDFTKNLNVDDEFNLQAECEYPNKGYSFAKRFTAFAADEIIERETARWFGYIKTTFEKDGYLYKRGIEELEKLECHKYDEEIAEIKEKIALKQQTERCEKAIGYIRDTYARYGYLYKKGVETLIQFECHDYDDEIKKIETDIAAAKVKKEKEYEDTHKRFVFSTDEYSHYSQLDGRIIVKGEKAYKITKAYYNKYDGLSFGARTEDFYSATGVDITNTSEGKAAIEKNIAEKAERKQIAERKNYFDGKINELKKIIIDNDELHKAEVSLPPNDEIVLTVFDTVNVYGGGYSIFTTKDNKIWYFENNGADGDRWDLNHISTGGAGGIGYYCDVNKVTDLIVDLQNRKYF